VVYRGCHNVTVENGCQPADIDQLPADIYGLGILLQGTLCGCNSAFCNAGRRTADTAAFLANYVIILPAISAIVVRRTT